MRQAIDSSSSLSSSQLDSTLESTTDQHADGVSLFSILPNARYFSADNIHFRSIAASPEQANAGDLVVYRIGEQSPEQLIAEAMARGAAGILTEQLLPSPLPQCIVGDVDLAVSQITAVTLGHPDRKLLTVGVIGPAGKTTTTLLVASLLRSAGIRTAYQTDLGDSDGVLQQTSHQPQPIGAPLLHWLAEARDSKCLAALLEISGDDLRFGRYDAIQFDLLIITGSDSGCQDYGPSTVQCGLERLAPQGVVIAPADDAKAIRLVRDSGVRMMTYGVRNAADLTAKTIDQAAGMTTLMVTHHDTTAIMETTLCGAAMAANHAAAAMAGILLDLKLARIVESLSQLRSLPGRGQRLPSVQHADVIVDAGGSPERCADALRTSRSTKGGGRLWCILAVDGTDDPQRLAQYGGLLERFATDGVISSDQQGQTSFLKACHAVLDGVEHCAAMRLVANHERAIHWAVSEAKPADTILILGGLDGKSAHQRRSKLKTVIGWVESAREAAETPAVTSSKPRLSVFK